MAGASPRAVLRRIAPRHHASFRSADEGPMVIGSGDVPLDAAQDADSAEVLAHAPDPATRSGLPVSDQWQRQVRAAEVRLLYENGTTGVVATLVIASLLAYAQWDVVPRFIVSAWLFAMVLVSAVRYAFVRQYWRAAPRADENGRWNARFVAGTAMAAAAWGMGAILLYRAGQPTNQVM